MNDLRGRIRGLLSKTMTARAGALPDLLDTLLTKDCVFEISCPFERFAGREDIGQGFYGATRSSSAV